MVTVEWRDAVPLVAGDVTALDAITTTLWGQIRLKSPNGSRTGRITAEVYMATDRSRFRVVDTSGKVERLSALQFCKFILELRSTGGFEFERGPPSRRAARIAEALAVGKEPPPKPEHSLLDDRKARPPARSGTRR